MTITESVPPYDELRRLDPVVAPVPPLIAWDGDETLGWSAQGCSLFLLSAFRVVRVSFEVEVAARFEIRGGFGQIQFIQERASGRGASGFGRNLPSLLS